MAFRVDIGSLRPAKFLADGRARFDAVLTRTGVFVYRGDDGKVVREYRPPGEVFSQASLDSFSTVVVTDDHPPTMINASNRATYERGTVLDNVRRDGNNMVASLIITSPELVAKMKAGKLDVSNGYSCDLVMTPGVSPEGEAFDAIQTNIVGNHTAIVEQGRAGNARARMDGAAFQIPSESPTGQDPTPRNDGAPTMDLTQALAAYAAAQKDLGAATAEATAQKARADKAETEAVVAKARADKAEGERDSEKARADKADKARTDAADGLAAVVDARVELETAARAVLGTDAVMKGKTDRAIKADVVEKIEGTKIAADKSDAYVEGRYDSALEAHKKTDAAVAKTADQLGAVRATVETARKADAAPKLDAETEARNKMIADNAQAWKQGK